MADKDSKRLNKRWLKASLITLAIFAVFGFGYGLGSGNVIIGSTKSSQNQNLPKRLDFASVQSVYELLKKNFDGELDEAKLLNGMKQGLVAATGDPHTEFLTAEQTTEFNESLDGTFSGIGAELSKDKDVITIVSPIAGFPAEKAGLKPKDVIAEIDGKSAYGISVSDAVKQIRGPEGTEVKLRIIRNQEEDLSFTVKRSTIKIPSVENKMLDNKVGYIKISRFSDDTVGLTREAATKLKGEGASSVILDVRGNPGGLLDAAVGVSSIWLSKGKTILEEKRAGTVIKSYTAKGDSILEGLPTIVMIDEGSASASEIVAGALRDNGVAKLLGQKSYGKGSVQMVEDLPGGASLKVTIAHWYTPNGRNIDKEGIEPDTKVEQKNDSKEDLQFKTAQDVLAQ